MRQSGLTLGALGGPHTFNGQAARKLTRHYPQFGEIRYFPTSEAVLQAALRGEITAACGQEQTSKDGFHVGMQARIAAPGSGLYAIAEIAQAYHCSLLGKPGGRREQVRRILGHTGSIAHSRLWLEHNLPVAVIETVETNSISAARAVLESDGSVASVGSPELAKEFGLTEIARDIDDGSAVNYWAVSLEPLFDPMPDRLAIAGRFRGESEMSRMICVCRDSGFDLHAIFPRASGSALYEYDYVFRFWGGGTLDGVQSVLSCCPSVRLAGAWRSRGVSDNEAGSS
jgi:chorismate mutase / prephenate dehydratase